MDEPIDPAFLRDSDLFENQPDGGAAGRARPGPAPRVRARATSSSARATRATGCSSSRAASSRSWPRPADGAEPHAGRLPRHRARCSASWRCSRARRAAPPCARPEHAELFTIEKPVFLDLMETLPAFSRNLCVVLAKRLEATTLKVPAGLRQAAPGQPALLRPRHRHPDPDRLAPDGQPVVTQDRASRRSPRSSSSRATSRGPSSGSSRATTRSSSSSRAPLEGEFSFTGREVAGGRGPERHQHARDLAAHGVGAPAGRAAAAQERLPDPERVFRQKAAQLAWEDPRRWSSRPRSGRASRTGASLNDLQRDIPRSSLRDLPDRRRSCSTAGQIE